MRTILRRFDIDHHDPTENPANAAMVIKMYDNNKDYTVSDLIQLQLEYVEKILQEMKKEEKKMVSIEAVWITCDDCNAQMEEIDRDYTSKHHDGEYQCCWCEKTVRVRVILKILNGD